LPLKGSFILASNHVSYLDPVAVACACPRKLNFMAKEELFSRAWSYSFFSAIKCFPIKRNSADLSALKEALRRLKGGEPLALFPEGSRTLDGASAAPYPGIGFLAAKLNIPVVPVYVQGTDVALPKGARFVRFTRISVCFGRQMRVDKKLSYKDIAQRIMENVRHLEGQFENF